MVSGNFGPVTTTSTGVGEPKLMTWLTMSAGSNDSRKPRTRSAASWAVMPPARSFLPNQSCKRDGSF